MWLLNILVTKFNEVSSDPGIHPHGGRRELTLFFLRFIYLFYVYEHTITLFRHTRRGHQIPLQMVASHHVGAGIELRTSGRTVGALTY